MAHPKGLPSLNQGEYNSWKSMLRRSLDPRDQSKLTGNKAGKNTQAKAEGYGPSKDNLGNLPPGDVDAVLSSPPYEGNTKDDYMMSEDGKTRARDERRGFRQGKGCFRGSEGAYGQTPGQLGIEHAESFWAASRTILEQVFALLRPGGYCAWILKAYVKNGKIVDFPGNWERLCNAVGFETVCKARAWLTKTESNPGLFGEVKKTKARKSFFRRLAEAKGSPPIDFEVVLFVRKP